MEITPQTAAQPFGSQWSQKGTTLLSGDWNFSQHRELRWKSSSCIKNETGACWCCRNLATPMCSKATGFPHPLSDCNWISQKARIMNYNIYFTATGNSQYGTTQWCSERNYASSELCFSFCRLCLHTGRCSGQGMVAAVFWFIRCLWIILGFCNTEAQLPWGKD